jgi:hypothetical protein
MFAVVFGNAAQDAPAVGAGCLDEQGDVQHRSRPRSWRVRLAIVVFQSAMILSLFADTGY